MRGFVQVHTITVIFVPYLVSKSRTKTDIKKMRELVFVCLESVEQENKQDGKI